MTRKLRARIHRPRGERGAALVEAALLLPLFFALVLGLITFGDAYFTRISIEDAVRDGTRFASTIDELVADADTSTDTAHEKLIKERVAGLAGGELKISEICVALVTATGANTACDLDDPDGSQLKTPPDEVVKVSASTTGRIEVIFFARDITLRAGAAAPYAR